MSERLRFWTDWHPLPGRQEVKFTASFDLATGQLQLDVEWHPKQPRDLERDPTLLQAYRTERDAFLHSVCEVLGLKAGVLELPTGALSTVGGARAN